MQKPAGSPPSKKSVTPVSPPRNTATTPPPSPPLRKQAELSDKNNDYNNRTSNLHPSVAAFIQNPLLVIRQQSEGSAADVLRPPSEEAGLLRDIQGLHTLVTTTEEEVDLLRRTITELEIQAHQRKKEALTRLYNDLAISTPLPPPSPVVTTAGRSSNGDAGLEQQLFTATEKLLAEVRGLEEQVAACRLENNTMEQTLSSLYAGILVEEKKQGARKEAIQADEAFCNALRLKLQEAQRCVWDYRQRARFVCAAEGKYVEQMETIQRLRDEVRMCGLQLPLTQQQTGEVGGVMPTCNRFRWERRCARRVAAALPPQPSSSSSPLLSGNEAASQGARRDGGDDDDDDNLNAVVTRVVAFPPGVLSSLHTVTLDSGKAATSAETERRSGEADGSSGLRRRAEYLGIRLQYEQHAETNPFLRRSSGAVVSEEDDEEDTMEKAYSAPGGVRVLVHGRRCRLDQFQREVDAAVAALGYSSPTWNTLRGRTSPHRAGTISRPLTRSDKSLSPRGPRQSRRFHDSPWRAAARAAQSSATPQPSGLMEGGGVSGALSPFTQRPLSPGVWGETFLRQLSEAVPQASENNTRAYAETRRVTAPNTRPTSMEDEIAWEKIRAGLRAAVSL
ncbi:hypothetical protein DQ04_06411010 [Trypanosoma grayi]|uniref:hypothetical protein n=1 Tax=Trypanosoma grayi TaxID=71804 RepID=UPI0004F437EF|nr:hypothetical protein DQ04_06411010 [Trypanosoma grayi]KEG08809.1 hypothetical protein DQ04_06411010 [Trypanosoma grayi]